MSQDDALTAGPVDIALPEAAIDAVGGTDLLVSGPPLTDKFPLLVALVSRIPGAPVFVTTKHPAADVVAAHRAASADRDPPPVGVVDAGNRAGPGGTDHELVRTVGSPDNLTRLGTEFLSLRGSMADRPDVEPGGVGLHSLSPLVMHAGLHPVYRFLGSLTDRLRREECRLVAVLDTPVAEADVDSLRHHFDGVVETRRTDDGRTELRVAGIRGVDADWTGY